MRLVGWLSGPARPENFPGCNRRVTDNLPCEMRDLTRELCSRYEESASHALNSFLRAGVVSTEKGSSVLKSCQK